MAFSAGARTTLAGLMLATAVFTTLPVRPVDAEGECVEGVGPNNERQSCWTGGGSSGGGGRGLWPLFEEIGRLLFGDGSNAAVAHPPSSAPLPLAMPVRTFHPTFNCNDATTAAEKRVCGNRDLSELDRQLAVAYVRLLRMLDRAHRIELGYEQHGWIARRDACQDDTACIANAYKRRTAEFVARTATLERASNPTFPCSRAQTDAEKRVCASADLAQLDRQLGAGYKKVRQPLSPAQQEKLTAQQNQWRERRDRCGNNDVCIAVVYSQRIADFQQGLRAPPGSQSGDHVPAVGPSQPTCMMGSCNPDPSASGIDLTPPPSGRPAATTGFKSFAALEAAMRDGKLADDEARHMLLARARFYVGCTFDRGSGCMPGWQHDLPKIEGVPRGIGRLSEAQFAALLKTKAGKDLATAEINQRKSLAEAQVTHEKAQQAYDRAETDREKGQLAVVLSEAKQEESNRRSELGATVIAVEKKAAQLLPDDQPDQSSPAPSPSPSPSSSSEGGGQQPKQ
jgi:uncharacterized protein